jgi:hypothetical protein
MKPALDGIQASAIGHRLDGLYVFAGAACRKRQAGMLCLAVDQHRAQTAFATIATDLGAGQPDDFAQIVDQQQIPATPSSR